MSNKTWYMAVANGDMGLAMSNWYETSALAVSDAIITSDYDDLTDQCFVITFDGDTPPHMGYAFFPHRHEIVAALGGDLEDEDE